MSFTERSPFANGEQLSAMSQTKQLHYAAHSGDLELLKGLLDFGVDPDIRSRDGWTAVHQASVAGETDCLALLLDAGADMEAIVTEEDIYGTTGLALAIMNGRIDTVDLLIKRGADLNRLARGSKNALAVAIDTKSRWWHKTADRLDIIIPMLQEAGATE